MVRLGGTWAGIGYEYELGSVGKVSCYKYKVTIIATRIYKTDNYKLKITYVSLTTPLEPNIIENVLVVANKYNFISEDATGDGTNTFSLSGKTLTFGFNINGSSVYGNLSGKYILYKIK
jgi:hypothetical protein